MELINPTGAVAYFFPVNLLEPENRAAVIVKKTYALDDGFQLHDAEDGMPLVVDRLDNDFGVFHGEIFFRKRGVDLCVLGTARMERPVRRATVRIEHGLWRHELRLTGNRVWEKLRSGDLAPSGPEPFQEMPITYARSFGGTADVDGEDVPWPDNPMGRDYYESAEHAVGKPLPNIEAAEGAMASVWNTRIPVAGWAPYPMYWGLRPGRAVEVDQDTGEILKLTPEIFNHAHPDLILEAIDPLAPFVVIGILPAPVRVSLPTSRPKVTVVVGNEISEVMGDLDGVFLWIDARRLVLTWRARFRYPVRPEEIRRAHLSFVE